MEPSIVRETGGLKDTVQAYNEYDNSGDGFSFTNYNADEMLQVINYSKHIFYDRKRQWNQMVDRGMANDFSWNASKFRYEDCIIIFSVNKIENNYKIRTDTFVSVLIFMNGKGEKQWEIPKKKMITLLNSTGNVTCRPEKYNHLSVINYRRN